MQGTAADIIKRAMIAVDRWIEGERPPVRMIMQVHDELVFEAEEDAVESAGERIRREMESAAELRVPLLVDLGIGDNWEEASGTIGRRRTEPRGQPQPGVFFPHPQLCYG
jgi:DNA polymerase-1